MRLQRLALIPLFGHPVKLAREHGLVARGAMSGVSTASKVRASLTGVNCHRRATQQARTRRPLMRIYE